MSAAADREQLRLSLLRFLDQTARRFGVPTATLLQLARSEGRREITREELEGELQYLADKGLIESTLKLLSPENRSWRITAAGRDHAATLNLNE